MTGPPIIPLLADIPQHPTTRQGRWMCRGHEKDLVSIVVPAFNQERTIVDSLESAVNQTYRPIELLVVDDGSTDDTEQLVSNWVDSRRHLDGVEVLFFRQSNQGVCAARNLALVNCSGEFIQYLDSDDLLHTNRLANVVRVFRESGCDFIQTGFDGFCDSCGQTIERHYGQENRDLLALALEGRLWPNTIRPVYRRDLAIETGPWDEDMVTLQDYDYVLRALLVSRSSIGVRDISVSARRSPRRSMRTLIQTRVGRECRLRAESRLCTGVRHRGEIPDQTLGALASRLFALGSRSNVAGWPDLAEFSGGLAIGLDAKLDFKGIQRKMVWRTGRVGALIYESLSRLKRGLAGAKGDWKIDHRCSDSGNL